MNRDMFSLISRDTRPGLRPGKNTIMPVTMTSTRVSRMKMVSRSICMLSSTCLGRVTNASTAKSAQSTASVRQTHSASGIPSDSLPMAAVSVSGMGVLP